MNKWNEEEYSIEGMDCKFRWRIEPDNWLSRLFYRCIKLSIIIDYIQMQKERESK